MMMVPSVALVQETHLIAQCLRWNNNSCIFSPLDPVWFTGLKLAQQTVCKADLTVAVKQIDWQSSAGGRGSVDSLLINGVEMLQSPVHPSHMYMIANYPHCDDMFSIFPPWGNGMVGPERRKSIIPEITSDSLSISIHYSWNGPHDDFPVCSMAGVSIAGYAEINIYLEAQENAVCPGWDSALHMACFGNGDCVCASNDISPRTCSCVCEPDMLLQIAATAIADFSVRSASEPASRALTTAFAIQACWVQESVCVLRVLTRTPGVQRACPDILEINASGVRIATFRTEIAMTV
ncbi:unnamed protein product [Peronospora destructor]|uniref:Uncharacterized protein n=1 Tax=Peronospora destructor TaxID=86335 RepID=A0AAV0UIQ2_9STRA|nr:unnamed protein product [Peronospora destructor]